MAKAVDVKCLDPSILGPANMLREGRFEIWERFLERDKDYTHPAQPRYSPLSNFTMEEHHIPGVTCRVQSRQKRINDIEFIILDGPKYHISFRHDQERLSFTPISVQRA